MDPQWFRLVEFNAARDSGAGLGALLGSFLDPIGASRRVSPLCTFHEQWATTGFGDGQTPDGDGRWVGVRARLPVISPSWPAVPGPRNDHVLRGPSGPPGEFRLAGTGAHPVPADRSFP